MARTIHDDNLVQIEAPIVSLRDNTGAEYARMDNGAGSGLFDSSRPAVNGGFSAVSAGSVVAGNGPYWLCAAGNILYATVTNDSRIQAYDISAKGGVPVLLGQVTVGTNTGWIEKVGKYLLASDTNAGVLRSINMGNPAAPTVSQTLSINSDGNGLQGRFGIQVRGNLLAIGGPAAGGSVGTVYIVDFSVPTAMTVVGSVALTGVVNIRGVCALGASCFAVTSRDDATVRIVDTAVPTAPVEVAKITTTQSNTTAGVAIQGRYLYITNYGNGTTGGLEVWDVGVPSQPVQAGVLSITGGAEQIVIRGGNLYIGHRPTTASNLVSIVDIRNPGLPKLLSTLSTGGDQTPGVAVANGFIYRSSTESPGSSSGRIYALRSSDDLHRRISALEDMLQLRPPNVD